MNFRATLLVVLSCLSGAAAVAPASADPIDLNQLQWNVASLIDQSREPYTENYPVNLPGQYFSPRDTRGMAISPDGRYLYLGYNASIQRDDGGLNPVDRQGEVRVIDLTKTGTDKFDTQMGTNRVLGNRGKAIAVDDVGRVYMVDKVTTGSNASRIDVYSADLSTQLFTITAPSTSMTWEGLAVTREAGGLMLYVSDRTLGTLSKVQLTESGADISAANPVVGFGTLGTKALAGASSLRNVEVDGSGNIWVASRDSDLLFRVSADGTVVQTAAINDPFDIGFNGTQVFVTHQNQKNISVFDIANFNSNNIAANTTSLVPPWAALSISPTGNTEAGLQGLLSGIVVIPGVGFYVGNEHGQTAGQKSIYGVTDAFSGNGFQDNFFDDNEPVFSALLPQAVPEPAAYVLALTGLVVFGGYARRQRQQAE
jgi:hypothetical protein